MEAKVLVLELVHPAMEDLPKGVAPNVGLYPRMHLMPNGLVVTCGDCTLYVRSWDPANGKWSLLGQTSFYRHYGASFLLPLHNITSERGKILLVGGSPDARFVCNNACRNSRFRRRDFNEPGCRDVASITYRRKEQAPVILPDGKCVIFGGSGDWLIQCLFTSLKCLTQ